MIALLQALADRWPLMLAYLVIMGLFHLYRLSR